MTEKEKDSEEQKPQTILGRKTIVRNLHPNPNHGEIEVWEKEGLFIFLLLTRGKRRRGGREGGGGGEGGRLLLN
jgi:hypothetical protein